MLCAARKEVSVRLCRFLSPKIKNARTSVGSGVFSCSSLPRWIFREGVVGHRFSLRRIHLVDVVELLEVGVVLLGQLDELLLGQLRLLHKLADVEVLGIQMCIRDRLYVAELIK